MGIGQLKKILLANLTLLFIFLAATGGLAAAPQKKGPEGDLPLHITAARLEADQQEGIIIFSGQVKATYGDSTLYADQLRVYFKPKPAGAAAAGPAPSSPAASGSAAAPASPLGELGAGQIDRLVAKGQVRFVQENKVATGDEAIYYRDKDEVVLLGNPQLWQAENTLKGERVIFHIKTNRVVVESSPQKRVEAHLYPQGAAGSKEILPLSPKTSKSRGQ